MNRSYPTSRIFNSEEGKHDVVKSEERERERGNLISNKKRKKKEKKEKGEKFSHVLYLSLLYSTKPKNNGSYHHQDIAKEYHSLYARTAMQWALSPTQG